MRKTLLLVAVLLLGSTSLFAQRTTPYKYGHRWYFSVQGGPSFYDGDYTYVFRHEGRWAEPIVPDGAFSLGYNFTDAHELRFTAMYAKNRANCVSIMEDLYPHTFKSASLFADYVLSFNALGEFYTEFNPKIYLGVGGAYTFEFSDPHHPTMVLTDPNLVPGFNFGTIMEYDFPSGLGLFADLGFMFLIDPGDGQGWIYFPLDMDIALNFGIVYHFKRSKR